MPKSSLSSKAWVVVQSLAVLSALISPIIWKGEMQGKLSSHSPNAMQEVAQLEIIKARPLSITSRILELPAPSTRAPASINTPLDFDIETSQLRFEHLSRQTGWKLNKILRKNESGAWENVELLTDSSGKSAVGSVFVELEEGLNEFLVDFESMHGKKSTRSYPVKSITLKRITHRDTRR